MSVAVKPSIDLTKKKQSGLLVNSHLFLFLTTEYKLLQNLSQLHLTEEKHHEMKHNGLLMNSDFVTSVDLPISVQVAFCTLQMIQF